jgi:carbamoyl-phosphate synthase small subunit
VFCTGQSGYEEVLTDPSYFRQIVVFTHPLVGNTGINGVDAEHGRPFLSGLVVREHEPQPSHHLCEKSLDDYLHAEGVPGLCGVDTRALTRLLRTHGTLKAALSADDASSDEVKERLAPPLPVDHVACTSIKAPQHLPGRGPHIALLDYGCKRGILRALLARGCAVTLFPFDATEEAIAAARPDGVVLSNGPGDPRDVPGALPVIRGLQERLPLFGICLGHQLFALANGATTHKLHHGHRGQNRAVLDRQRKRSAIASHNHGYAVDAASLPGTELDPSFFDVNDGCVEGLRHRRLPAFSVQFHPEAGPGPLDAQNLFDEFLATVLEHAARREGN